MPSPLFIVILKKIDAGKTYQVVDVQDFNVKYGVPVEFSIAPGDSISIELKKQLMLGNFITIPVKTVDSVREGNLTLESFKSVIQKGLEAYKNQKLKRIRSIFSFYLSNTGGIVLFRALNSFSVLASKGYFITEENREEKYLEIINTGDEKLISSLEEYLESYDNLSPISSLHTELKKAELAINDAKSEEEVDAACHMFETSS